MMPLAQYLALEAIGCRSHSGFVEEAPRDFYYYGLFIGTNGVYYLAGSARQIALNLDAALVHVQSRRGR